MHVGMTEPKRTLLEYVSTDAFALLYLTGGVDATRISGVTSISAFNTDFDQDIVSIYQTPGSITEELPSVISCSKVEFSTDEEGDLHSKNSSKFGMGLPSFSCASMSLIWRVEVTETDKPNPAIMVTGLSRLDGPALITLENLKFYHRQGIMTSVSFDTMKCLWYNRGNLYRRPGPHSVTIINFKGLFDPKMGLYSTQPVNHTMLWNHPGDGSNITTERVKKIAAEFEVPINYLSPTETVFDNTMEEMIFFSNV